MVNYETAVKCDYCGKFHLQRSETYFSVYGNIYIGMEGGIVGNNFGENYVLKKASIFCKKCLVEILNEFLDDKPEENTQIGY